MTLLFFVNKLLSLGTIVSQIAVVVALVYLVFFAKKNPAPLEFFKKHALQLVFIVSLVSICSSLFYSEIAGFVPCDLCWFQRIFMYPLVFLSGLALIKKDHRIVDYLLTLSVVGFFISLYQNYLYYTNSGLKTICQIGGGVSCVKRYVLEFGYVTIPLMALTAFVIITMILVLQKMYGKYSE